MKVKVEVEVEMCCDEEEQQMPQRLKAGVLD